MPLLLIILHHSLLVDFVFWLSFLFWGLHVLCFLLLLIFILLCFLLLIYLCFFFLFACILFDCSCCCVYLFFLFLLSYLLFFFSPGPRARTWKGKQWKHISHFVCFVAFFCPQNIFVWCSWNMFWGSKGFFAASFLLLFCCFGVWKRAFFRSNLSLVPGLFGLVVFSVRVLLMLCVEFLLVWCFLGSALFLWNALRHLGVVLSSLLCPHAASSTSCLGCSFVRVGFWAIFLWEPSWGSFGHGHEGGANIFFAFSRSRGVWVKTGAALEGEVCFLLFRCFKIIHLRGRQWPPLSIFDHETLHE